MLRITKPEVLHRVNEIRIHSPCDPNVIESFLISFLSTMYMYYDSLQICVIIRMYYSTNYLV